MAEIHPANAGQQPTSVVFPSQEHLGHEAHKCATYGHSSAGRVLGKPTESPPGGWPLPQAD